MNRMMQLAVTAMWGGAFLASSATAAGVVPGVYYYEADRMADVRQMLAQHAAEEDVRRAAEALSEEANQALNRGPYSVLDKDVTPPSGDKHDYVSYSVYWWPAPQQPDGLPWIRRDGQTNHVQRAKGDRNRLGNLINDVELLTLARYFHGRDDCGLRAASLIRAWFLDESTRMNPHLRYAQAVPGLAEGRNSGIIDARGFVELLDCVAILNSTGDLSDADLAALREWFTEYFKWLTTSELGKKERAAKNNHGHWYAAQVARIALFLGDEAAAREYVEVARDERLPVAIMPDGRQPEELSRTRSLHYSLFSLDALAYLARYGEALEMDLWNYRADNGASIELGLAYAAPYVLKQNEWPYEQLHDYRLSSPIVQLFRMASSRYDNPVYDQVLREAPRTDEIRDFTPLLFRVGE